MTMASHARNFPRTARLNELVRQIVADALERLDDDRLDLVAITGVLVEPDLRHATVYFDTLRGEDDDAAILEMLVQHRVRLQQAIASQTHLKRTPELRFAPDEVERQAARVDEILRGIHTEDPPENPKKCPQ